MSSGGVTPPVPERTHTQQVLHVTLSFPLPPWVTSYRCHSSSYAVPELRAACCVELPSPGYGGLQLGHTNCLNHINNPSQQVGNSHYCFLSLENCWNLWQYFHFSNDLWVIPKHQFIISLYHRSNHLVFSFPDSSPPGGIKQGRQAEET